MKYMVISDIHGDIYALDKVIDIYAKESCSKLLILGDLFSYNFSYNDSFIIDRLNSMKNNIICVRGNCDYDISLLEFNMPYIENVILNNKKILLTHGHLYTNESLKNMECDICFRGHSHISDITTIDNTIFVNPGSISKSRSGENSFCIVNFNTISIRNLENIEIMKKKI